MPRELTPADIRLRRSESTAAYFPAILTYPFRPGARSTVIFIALFSWLFSSHILALPGLILTISAMLQFLMLVIQHTASGRGDTPMLGSFRSFTFSLATFGLVILVSAGIALQFAVAGSQHLAILVAVLNCLLLPAMILLLSLEESLLHALEPRRIFRVLANAGPAYPVFAVVLGFGCWGLYELLMMRTDSFGPLSGRLSSELSLATLLSLLAGMALLTSLAHYLGYIAYHRHEAMGLNEGFLNTAPVKTAESHPLEAIETLSRRGEQDATRQQLAALAADLPLAKRIAWVDELEKRRLWSELRGFSEDLIADLLQARQEGVAAELLLRMLRHYPGLSTKTAGEWLALTRGAFKERPEQGFETLARLAQDRFPGDPVLLDIALLQAQFLVDRKQDSAAARRLLEPYLAWQDHPRYNRIERLVETLRND